MKTTVVDSRVVDISRRALPWVVAVVVVILSPHVLNGTDLMTPMILAGLYAVTVVGLSVLQGQAGIVSLGQGGFVAVGTYTVGLLTVKAGWAPVPALIAGILTTMLVALITVPILRISGLALSLVTFAIAVIMQELIDVFTGLTGGENGVANLPALSLGSWVASQQADYLVVTWLIVLVLAALVLNLRRSPYGAALRAQEVDTAASSALGIPVLRVRSAAWLFAAGCAGLSGGLLALYLNYITPDYFTLDLSIALLSALVIGGMNSVFGPIVAIILLEVVPQVAGFGGHVPSLVWSGGMLLIIPAFAAGGLAALYRSVRDRAVRRLAPAAPEPELSSASDHPAPDFHPGTV
jgi:branched-chain amino acid transport system permease protein